MLNRSIYNDDHYLLRDSIKEFFKRELLPKRSQWESDGIVDRDFWLACGNQGLLLPDIPQEFGGGGLDFKINAIILEETAFAGTTGPSFTVQNDIVAHYIYKYGTETVKRKWLPKMAKGEAIGAICMSEPDTGSDLRAIRTKATPVDGGYLLNGSKIFITNGISCDVGIVAARNDNTKGQREISLFVCDANADGFIKGRKLEKVGNHASDTAELFFNDMYVPSENLLGKLGAGFYYMMNELPQERISVAISCQAAAQHAYDITIPYVKERKAFGKTLMEFQNTRFVLAEMKTKLQVGWAHIDACINALVDNQLTVHQAAAAKLWHSELRSSVVDECLQLFGGYGYMEEYEIARLWRDSRVMRIYGGTSEIMKELISRSL